MKKPGTCIFMFFVLIFVLTTQGFSLMPKDCGSCWSVFNSLPDYQVLNYDVLNPGTILLKLKGIRAALEKARIGDKISVKLVLKNSFILQIGTFSPIKQRQGNFVREVYATMVNKKLVLPQQLGEVPGFGKLIITDSSGQVKCSRKVNMKTFQPG